MKIGNDKLDLIGNEQLNSNLSKTPDRQQTSGDLSSQDRMELSAQALDMQKMTEMAQAAPDVRSEEVARTRDALLRGSYSVSADGIAEKLLMEETIDEVV